jgi:hypothetical protein
MTDVSQNLLNNRRAFVDITAREQAIEGTTKAIDIAAGIGIVGVRRLLGGHVVDRAHHRAGVGKLMIGGVGRAVESGQAHVENLDHALVIEQEVGRLDVAMDDATAVSIGQATSSLQYVVGSIGYREWAMFLDEDREVLAVDVFHDQIPDAALHASVVGMHDVRVAELGGSLYFTLKAFDRGFVFSKRRW